MKLLILLFLNCILLFASDTLSIKVQKGSLTVKIGNDNYEKLEQGMQKNNISCDTKIEIVEGNGTLDILHGKKVIETLNKKGHNYTVNKEVCLTVLEKIARLFNVFIDSIIKTDTQVRHAGSTKGIEEKTQKQDIVIKKDKVAICGYKWGALDYRFELYGKDKKKPIYYTTEFIKQYDDIKGEFIYCFILDKSKLLQGNSYKIKNNVGFYEEFISIQGNIILK